MINDDVLVKFSLSRIKNGHPLMKNWVDYTRLLSDQILYITLGFPGIGKGDLCIIDKSQITGPGERIIIDDNLDANCGVIDTDHAAILGMIKEYNPDTGQMLLEIEGIGQGTDFSRDPERKLKWKDIMEININNYPTLLTMVSKPKIDGGPVYYYYMKHNRDSRW